MVLNTKRLYELGVNGYIVGIFTEIDKSDNYGRFNNALGHFDRVYKIEDKGVKKIFEELKQEKLQYFFNEELRWARFSSERGNNGLMEDHLRHVKECAKALKIDVPKEVKDISKQGYEKAIADRLESARNYAEEGYKIRHVESGGLKDALNIARDAKIDISDKIKEIKSIARKKNKEATKRGKNKGLEGTLIIMCFIFGIFFLSTNITGNVIKSLNYPTSNIMGIILFFIGIVGVLFYFKNKQGKINL